MPADKFQTIDIPKVGPVDFPSDMPDDQIHDAIVRNYPDIFKDQRAEAQKAFDQITPHVTGTPGLNPLQPSLLPSMPDASITTAAGRQRRQQLNEFNARQSVGTRTAQEQGEDVSLFGGRQPQLQAPTTPQQLTGASPLGRRLTAKEAAAQRVRKNIGQMALSPEQNKDIEQRLEADKAAAPENPYSAVAQHSLLPSILAVYGSPSASPEEIDQHIRQFLAPQHAAPGTIGPADTTTEALAKGAGRGAYNFASGLLTPENLALMGLLGKAPENIGTAANIGFMAQMGQTAAERTKQAYQDVRAGRTGEATEAGVDALLNAGMAGLSALHAQAIEPERTTSRTAPAPPPEPVAPRVEPIAPVARPVEAAPIPTTGPTGQPVVERRASTRKRVSEMTPEELRVEALTSEKTGLNNRRAFDELQQDKPASVVGFSDVDGLKALNDNFGYAAGDALLKAKADSLREAGVEAYHDKGDEFLYRGDKPKDLQAKLEKARAILRDKEITFQGEDGQTHTVKGADFSYGVGQSLGSATTRMHGMKTAREKAGERARGSMGNIKEVGQEQPGQVPAEAAPTTPPVEQPVTQEGTKAWTEMAPSVRAAALDQARAELKDKGVGAVDPDYNNKLKARAREIAGAKAEVPVAPPTTEALPVQAGPTNQTKLEFEQHVNALHEASVAGDSAKAQTALGELRRLNDANQGYWNDSMKGFEAKVPQQKPDLRKQIDEKRAANVAAKAEVQPVQAEVPVKPETPKAGAHALEPTLRKLTTAIIRTRQLQAAAKDRLAVEEALQVAGHKRTEGKETFFNDNPLAQKHVPPSGLSKDRLAMIESVSKALGLTPNDLYERNYRLTDDEFSLLQDMLKQSEKPMDLGTLSPTHPENRFSTKAPFPLAAINEANAKVAGVPGAKDLWRDKRAERQDFKSRGVAGAGEAAVQAAGLETGGRRQARAGAMRESGKDLETLIFEHNQMQDVLAKHLKRVTDELNKRLPEWRAARIDTPEASQLAKDIAALDKSSKVGIPKELYAKEHLTTKARKSAKAPVAQEPVQSAEPTKATSSAEGESAAKDAQDQHPELVDSIMKTHEAIQAKHGEDRVVPMEKLFTAVQEKFSDAGTQLKAYDAIAKRYQSYLDKGTEEPMLRALADVDKLPPEGNGATFHANPVGPLYKKLFGFNTPYTQASFPHIQLADMPIEKFTADVKGTTPPTNAWDNFRNYAENEKRRIKTALQDVPQDGVSLWRRAKELAQAAWDAYKTRPGLSPLQWALGGRQLQLQGQALAMHQYIDAIVKKHPKVDRREAMVNYLQAGGGVLPDHIVNADLQLKANSFGAGRTDIMRLKQGYLDAQNLTPEEKQTIADYRKYDNELRQSEQAAGLEVHATENYIRQIWHPDSFTRKAIEGVFHAGSFTTSGAFMKMRKFENYFEGEMQGLKPHRKDFAYLVGARARAGAEVLANRAFIEQLHAETMPNGDPMVRTAGIGVPQGTVVNPDGKQMAGAILIKGTARPGDAYTSEAIPRPYQTINHPAFQNWKWVSHAEGNFNEDGSPNPGTTIMYKGAMLVHPDVAPQLRRILEPSKFRTGNTGAVLRPIMKMSAVGKQTLLIGLFHPVQLGVHFLEHAAEGGTSGKAMTAINPFAKPVIDLENNLDQQQLVVHGLKVADFNNEAMWDEGVMSRGFANAAPIVGKFLSGLHDAMFQRYIPNLKMAMAEDALKRNVSRYLDKYTAEELRKQGMNQTSAALEAKSRIYRMTAEQMNAAFGGLNWDNMPIDKTGQDFLRLMVLAPDFLLARMQFAGDAFRPGGMESRKALLIGAFVQYAAARAFNYAMNDGDAKWDPHDWNKFIAGRHEYSLRTVQGDMFDSVEDARKFWSHRLNPLTLRPLMEVATQRDVFGHHASAGQMLYDFAKNFTPIPVQGGLDKLFHQRVGIHDETIADTIAQSMGLQRKQYRTPAQRFVYSTFDNLQGDTTQDDLALEQKNSFRRFRQQFEEGKLDENDLQHALDNGTLKLSQLKYLHRTAKETRFKREARQLQPHEVMKAFDMGTDMEKYELAPLVLSKLKNLPPAEREGTANKIYNWLDQQPDAKKEKLFNSIRTEIEYENPAPPEPPEEAPSEENNQ